VRRYFLKTYASERALQNVRFSVLVVSAHPRRTTVPVSFRTPNEAEAIIRAQAVLAEGLIATEAYAPEEPTPRRREIHSLIEQYLKEAQSRHKRPLRPNTADVRRYILEKFVVDCSIYRVGDITLPKTFLPGFWMQQAPTVNSNLRSSVVLMPVCYGKSFRKRESIGSTWATNCSTFPIMAIL
jgi:hypothetical protein